MIGLPPEAGAMLSAAATKPDRYSMQGVRVIELREGFRLEATNGRMLAVLRGPEKAGVPGHAEVMVHEGIEAVLEAPCTSETEPVRRELAEYLVPADAWKAAFAKAPKHGLAMGAVGDNVIVSDGVSRLTHRLLDGRFPDLNQVANDRMKPLARVDVNLDLLAGALKLARSLTPLVGEDDGVSRATLMIFNGAMVGIAAAGQGYAVDLVVMGFTEEEDKRRRRRHSIPKEALRGIDEEVGDGAPEAEDEPTYEELAQAQAEAAESPPAPETEEEEAERLGQPGGPDYVDPDWDPDAADVAATTGDPAVAAIDQPAESAPEAEPRPDPEANGTAPAEAAPQQALQLPPPPRRRAGRSRDARSSKKRK